MYLGKNSTAINWDQSYKNHNYTWTIEGPSPELVSLLCVEMIKPPGLILDIGCGLGNEAVFLSSLGYNVHAIDHSQEAINMCMSRHRGHPVTWRAESVTDVSLQDESVHFANDRGCFHVIPAHLRKEYVDEVYRVLKPNAALLIRGSLVTNDYWDEVSEETIDMYFDEDRFVRGPILPMKIFSETGGIKGNMVSIKKR
ncbi:class I SAM-dependent methyltransferase [Fictibacillus norfolkensis]|jgi:ubiquinone/menaquinone biosynthesis C-methylase UbiE|uniref:Class I SAM-dependent methyltransferase n=1 Tax=Fictibacillus norfolkensis TaxID=2762233 RepID=A0ABR8SH24_9BACL|nr:class I SAM-dependent methyltransferase [Fictibacillus norfolkensis]MBD7962768.1 class I SAM-dependent methyltransferase [Fictibacillus norfolkensis]